MTGAIKINGIYGVKIGNLQVFTYEGAVNAYKIFCELFNRDMTMDTAPEVTRAERTASTVGRSPGSDDGGLKNGEKEV